MPKRPNPRTSPNLQRLDQRGPKWAAHRVRVRVNGAGIDLTWDACPWYYLGPGDAFALPGNGDALSELLMEHGFDAWWEGRASAEDKWEFVEVTHVLPRALTRRN